LHTMKGKKTKAADLDRAFDEGEDISDLLDVDKARRPDYQTCRVKVDFPDWMIQALDREARRLGITRQSLIKLWITNQLGQRKAP